MKPHARRKTFTGLLLMAMALLAPGCASDGTYYQTEVGVYGYGYYGAYDPGYYRGDVIVGAPGPPVGVHPPPPGARPPAPPHVSQLPSRPMPAPAPRPMPARGGGGRR